MPRFNYKGFRYVEVVADRPVELSAENLTAYAMHSDVTPVGHIETSNDLVDKLWDATNKAYLSNLMGYPTDCPPAREERLDGRRPPGHRNGAVQLRRHYGLREVARRPPRRTAAQRCAARHHPHRRLGLRHGQRAGLDEYHRHHPVEPLPLLRGHEAAGGLLREYQTLCRSRRPPQPGAPLLVGTRRLGARPLAVVAGADLVGLFLRRCHDPRPCRRPVRPGGRPEALRGTGRRNPRGHQRQIPRPCDGHLCQRHADRAERSADVGRRTRGDGRQGRRATSPARSPKPGSTSTSGCWAPRPSSMR